MKTVWFDVFDSLPGIERGRIQLSVEVIAKLKNGQELPAFYAHGTETWYSALTCKHIKQDVIAWKFKEALANESEM